LGTAGTINRLFAARHFAIEPATNPASSTGTVKLYFKQSEFDNYNAKALDSGYYPLPNNGLFTVDSLRVLQYHGIPSGLSLPSNYSGALAELAQPDGVTIIWNAVNSLWVVTIPVNGFSGFFISSKPRPSLPVKVEYFNGLHAGPAHLLEWKVTPVNTLHAKMELEISSDGRSFHPIYVLLADQLQMQNAFSYSNLQLLSGINYYRLKCTDDNGLATISRVIALRNSGKKTELISISPNPVKEGNAVLTIDCFSTTSMTILIRDMTGRMVYQGHASLQGGSNMVMIDIRRLAAGIYNVVGMTQEGNTQGLSFVKQ
jgi:hypothetical protein